VLGSLDAAAAIETMRVTLFCCKGRVLVQQINKLLSIVLGSLGDAATVNNESRIVVLQRKGACAANK